MPKTTKSSGKMFNSKSKKSQTPWLKNAMRSIGISSNEVLKDLSPNIYEVVSSGAKTLSDVKKISRKGSTSSALNTLSSNKFVKMGQETIKNALEDIRTGNFNNTERQDKAMEKAMGLDSFDDDFGTFLDDSDWDSDGWDSDDSGSPIVQQYISNGAGNDAIVASTVELSKEIRNQSETQLKVAKANLDTMISISSAQMMQSQEIGNTVISHLGNISNSLASIVEYNNENMTRFIESSLAFMEKMGAREEEQNSFDDKITPSSVYNNNKGGLNVSNYKKLVLQQFQKEFKGSQIGFFADMIAQNPEIITSNPIGFVSKTMIAGMVPKVLKETMRGVEEAFSGFIPTMLGKIADLGDRAGDSIMNNILRMFGKTFGVRNDRINGFDLSGAATKDAAVFDKMTRHSIVEIMPKYLRESSSYLKEILELLGGDSARTLNRAEAFDYQEGKYRSVADINDDVYGTIRNTVINKLDMTKYGSSLRNQGRNLSPNQQMKYDRLLDDFFLELEKNGKHLDVTDFSNGSKLSTILSSLNGDASTKKVLEAALKLSAEDKTASLNANVAIQQAIAARNDIIRSMEEDPHGWNLYTAAADKHGGIDEQIKVSGNLPSSTISKVDKRKGTPVSLLNDIFGILSRGINVKILKGKPFNSYESSSVSITETPITETDNSDEYAIIKDKDLETDDTDVIMNKMREQGMIFDSDFSRSTKFEKGVTSAGEHIKNAMYAIAYGNSSLAFDEIGSIVGDQIVSIGSKFKKDFLDPMITSVLGKKNRNGYSEDGLLSGVQNKFLDMYSSFKREFSGKGYIDSHGKKIEDKKDGEESVVGNIKSMMTTVKKSMMDYIFGEKEVDEKGNPTSKRKKGHGALGFAVNSLREGFEGFSEFIFGKKEDNETLLKSAKEKASEVLPSSITGFIGGGLTGIAAGSSLLGTLVGGPLGGALIGGTMGIVSKSEKFQDWLFGKQDPETHERIGGFISKKFQNTLKENKTAIIGGAALGFAKNAIFGGSGLLGSLVGGPIAGAIIGGTIGMVRKSEAFQEFLYGSEVTGKDGVTKKIGGILNAFNGIFKKKDKEDGPSASKVLGMGAIGVGAGALGASVIGHMGLLGAMFTPFGPVGGALAGLALSIKASNKGFREYLFGSDVVENGEVVGHKNGILQKFGNMLQVELFEPMKDGLANFAEDAQDFIIDKMLAPVEFAVAPFIDRLSSIAEGVKEKLSNTIDAGAKLVKDNIIDPIVQVTRDVIINPMKKIFGGMFQAVWGVSKMILAAPFTGLSLLTNFNDARNRKASRDRVIQENIQNEGFLKSFGKNMAIRLNIGNARKDAEYKYTDYAEEWDERKRQYNEDRDARRAQHRSRREERLNESYNRRMLGRWLGYDDVEDTEENRAKAIEEYEKWAKKHPVNSLFSRNRPTFKGSPINVSKDGLGFGEPTASEVINQSNSKKLGITAGILKEVHAIAQTITKGKSPLGNHGKNDKDIKNSSKNSKKEDNDGDQSSSTENDGVFSRAYQAILNIKNRRKGFSKNKKIPGFAQGTKNAPEGFAIVGENGPEPVYLNGGEQIISNDEAIKVDVVGMDDNIFGKFMSTFLNIFKGHKKSKTGTIDPNKVDDIISLGGADLLSSGSIEGDDGDIILDALQSKKRNSEAQAALDKSRKAKTYEANRKAKKEEEKENREKETLEVLKGQKKESKEHFNLWSSIFSKKGLITGGLIALSPLLIKYFKNFMNIGGVVKDSIQDLIDAFKNGKNNTENGDNATDRIEENTEELTDAAKSGSWLNYITPNGELDSLSGAKTNFAYHHLLPVAKTVGKLGYGAAKKIAKGGTSAVKGGAKVIGKTLTTGANVIGGAARVSKNILQNGKNAVLGRLSNTSVGNAGKTIMQYADDTVIGPLSKNVGGFVSKISSGIKTFYSTVSNYLVKRGFKPLGGKASKLIDDLIGFVTQHSGELMKKFSSMATKATNTVKTIAKVAATPVVMMTIGAVNGASGPARLFRVDNEYVTPTMTAISAAIGSLTATATGSIIDIVNEFVCDIMGVDFIHEFAVMIYHLLEGDDAYNELKVGEEKFAKEYSEYKDKTIEEQRNTYNLTHGTNYSEEEFAEKVSNGEINVNYDSFATYNDKEHQTLGTKLYNTVGKPIVKGIGTAKSFLFGKKEEYYQDSNGNKYVSNKNGTYQVYDSSGNDIGYISDKELPQDLSLFSEKTQGALTSVLKIGKNVLKWGLEAGGAFANGISSIVDNFYNKDVDFSQYMSADVNQTSEDNPLHGILNFVLGGTKLAMFPILTVTGVGKKLLGFIGNIIGSIGTIGSDMFTSVDECAELARSGEISNFYAYEPKISEDNPLGIVSKAAVRISKLLFSPYALFKGATKTIGKVIYNMLPDDAKNILTDTGEYISTLSTYTDLDKDMSGFNSEKFGNYDDDDPVVSIVKSISKSIMSIYVNIVRGIKSIGKGIADGFTGAIDWVGDKVTGAKDWLVNKVNKPMTAIMNAGRGGKGDSDDTLNGFPYYSQKDPRWKDMPYDMKNGKETMGQSGCGPDAMAMIATKMTGKKVTPIEVARDAQAGGYRDSSGTNWGFVDSAANKYGLSTSRVENPNKQYIRSELSKGRPVMLSGVGDGYASPYTSQGHYVVATGMSGNDVMINDPRGIGRSGKYNLDQVAGNAGAAWSFDKKRSNGGKGPTNILQFKTMQQNVASNTMEKSTPAIVANSVDIEDSKLEKAREMVVATMMSLKGKLHYTQDSGTREQVMQGVAGDCSSTCRWVYKHATGIDPGGYTGAQINSPNGSDVDNTPTCPDEKNLLPGDLLFFKGKNGSVGHVEMYIGNGQLMGHGGPSWNDMGPTVKDMKTYCNSRASSGKGYMKARRFILDKNADKVTLSNSIPTISGSTSTIPNSSNGGSIFEKLGNFFTAFAEKAWTGLTTGVWDTDYSSVFGDSNSSNITASNSSSSDSIETVNINPGELERSTYDFFTKNGVSPEATAGIMGNIYQESKFDPSCIQGNGKGPAAGLFQWENYNAKSKRWAAMNNYAESRGKTWTDPQSQLEYALSEMRNENWMWNTPSNKSLTYVGSWDEYKNMTNPQDAAVAFSNHFERPGTPQNSKRKAAAQEYYNKFGKKSFFGGGRGGDDNIFSIGQMKYYNPSEYSQSSFEDNLISFDKYTPTQRIHKNSSDTYNRIIRMEGGKGSANGVEGLLQKVIELLTSISTSSQTSVTKLDMLKNLSSIGASITSISNNKGPTVITTGSGNNGSSVLLGATRSRNEMLANKIASGQ